MHGPLHRPGRVQGACHWGRRTGGRIEGGGGCQETCRVSLFLYKIEISPEWFQPLWYSIYFLHSKFNIKLFAWRCVFLISDLVLF